jgi:hypothetical protein
MKLAADLPRDVEVRPAAERSSPPSLQANNSVESNHAGISTDADETGKGTGGFVTG